jgi:hypothetical protein
MYALCEEETKESPRGRSRGIAERKKQRMGKSYYASTGFFVPTICCEME